MYVSHDFHSIQSSIYLKVPWFSSVTEFKCILCPVKIWAKLLLVLPKWLQANFKGIVTMFLLWKIWAAWPSMLSVSLIRCNNEALNFFCFIKVLQKSENRQVTRFTILIISCCVRIKDMPDCGLNGDIQSIHFLIVTTSISKLLHSWLFIDPSEHHYTTQTSKFKIFKNRSSTMLKPMYTCSFGK